MESLPLFIVAAVAFLLSRLLSYLADRALTPSGKDDLKGMSLILGCIGIIAVIIGCGFAIGAVLPN